MANFFECKNGMRFRNCLVNAAEGDTNIALMFIDNMSAHKMNFVILPLIEKAEFKLAVSKAFNWKKSHEGKQLWKEVHHNMGNGHETKYGRKQCQ